MPTYLFADSNAYGKSDNPLHALLLYLQSLTDSERATDMFGEYFEIQVDDEVYDMTTIPICRECGDVMEEIEADGKITPICLNHLLEEDSNNDAL
mgnify:CR=1 FL=1